MIRFGFLAQMIPCGGHVFTDSLCDLLPYCEHFFAGNIFRKVHVDVNGQSGKLKIVRLMAVPPFSASALESRASFE